MPKDVLCQKKKISNRKPLICWQHFSVLTFALIRLLCKGDVGWWNVSTTNYAEIGTVLQQIFTLKSTRQMRENHEVSHAISISAELSILFVMVLHLFVTDG